MAVFNLFANSKKESDFAKKLGNQYNERVVTFHDFEENAEGFESDSRITITGHGTKTTYGSRKFSPESLGAFLINHGLKKEGVVIDLFGCEIGVIDDNSSYALRLANYLQMQNYEVRVNAFTTLKSVQEVSALRVAPNEDKTPTIWSMALSTKKAAEFKDVETRALQPLQQNRDTLKAQLQKKQKEMWQQYQKMEDKIEQLRKESPGADEIKKLEIGLYDFLTQEQDSIQVLESQLAKIREKAHAISHNLFMERSSLLDTTSDIRRTLDNNENYHVSTAYLTRLKSYFPDQKNAVILINNLIAELKNDIYKYDNQSTFQRFWDNDTSKKQADLAKYQKLAKDIEKVKSREELVKLLQMAKFDSTMQSGKHLNKLLQYMLDQLGQKEKKSATVKLSRNRED